MDMTTFFEQYKRCIDNLDNENIIVGNTEDGYWSDGTNTHFINTALVDLVRAMKLKIRAETTVGRGGYSDFTILSQENKELIEIEHENRPLHIRPTKRKKQPRLAMVKSLDNLVASSAEMGILITYTYYDIDEERLLNICRSHLNENHKQRKPIYLFHAPSDYERADEELKMELL